MTWFDKFGIHYLFNNDLISRLFILIPYIILYEHSCLHLLRCTWLRCIRSCIEDLSHGFFANKWLVHNLFISLGNLLEVVVHHLLIEEMVGFGYRDEFPMVSALMCMVTHWIGPTVSHNLKVSNSYNLTKLFHYVVSQHWENIELVLKLVVVLTYGWDRKLVIYSLWIWLLLMEVGSNRYS